MKNFKIILCLILVIFIYSSCKKRKCSRTVKDMKIYSIVSYKTNEPVSGIPNWFHSEFQTGQLHFSIEFNHYGAGENCEYYWGNYPLENTIEIYCDKDIIAGVDTIQANEKLNEYFIIEKKEVDFWIAFLLSENTDKNMQLNSEYYTFNVKLTTDKGEKMQDECLVKIN